MNSSSGQDEVTGSGFIILPETAEIWEKYTKQWLLRYWTSGNERS